MDTIHKIIVGLQIVLASKSTSDVCAEHDIIYAGMPEEMTDEENKKMKELGWHVGDADSWAIFV